MRSIPFLVVAALLIAPVATADTSFERSAEVEPAGPAPGASADVSVHHSDDQADVETAGAVEGLPADSSAGTAAEAEYDHSAKRWRAGVGAGEGVPVDGAGVYTVRRTSGTIVVYQESNGCPGLQTQAQDGCDEADQVVLQRQPPTREPIPGIPPVPGTDDPVPSGVPDEPGDSLPGRLDGLPGLDDVLGMIPDSIPDPMELIPDQAPDDPGDQVPGDPADELPGDPGDGMPDDQLPGDQDPGDQLPGDEDPGEQVPGDPGDELPGDEEPEDQVPDDQLPGDEEPEDLIPGDPGDELPIPDPDQLPDPLEMIPNPDPTQLIPDDLLP